MNSNQIYYSIFFDYSFKFSKLFRDSHNLKKIFLKKKLSIYNNKLLNFNRKNYYFFKNIFFIYYFYFYRINILKLNFKNKYNIKNNINNGIKFKDLYNYLYSSKDIYRKYLFDILLFKSKINNHISICFTFLLNNIVCSCSNVKTNYVYFVESTSLLGFGGKRSRSKYSLSILFYSVFNKLLSKKLNIYSLSIKFVFNPFLDFNYLTDICQKEISNYLNDMNIFNNKSIEFDYLGLFRKYLGDSNSFNLLFNNTLDSNLSNMDDLSSISSISDIDDNINGDSIDNVDSNIDNNGTFDLLKDKLDLFKLNKHIIFLKWYRSSLYVFNGCRLRKVRRKKIRNNKQYFLNKENSFIYFNKRLLK